MLKSRIIKPFPPEKDGIAIYSDNLLSGFGKNRKHIVTIGRKGSRANYIIDFKSFSLKKRVRKNNNKRKIKFSAYTVCSYIF